MTIWRVWRVGDDPSNGRLIETGDEEEAAVAWGDCEDSYGESWLTREGSAVVLVACEGSDDAPIRFVVGAEETVIYSAYQEA